MSENNDAGRALPGVNVCDFGARGDGVHDDTPAIEAAIAAAREGAGVVYFPCGAYALRPIRVPSHITLMGFSAWGYENRENSDSDFEGRTKLVALSGEGRALLDLGSERGTRIIGLTLDGRKLGERLHGIYARHAGCEQHVVVEDCRISRFSGSGIRFERTWVFAVRRSLIMDNDGHGIDLTGGYDGWVIDCQLSANGGAGLFARGEPPEDMSEAERAGFEGFFGTASVMVTADRIEWNRAGGVILKGSNSMQLTGCSIDHNFGPGVMLKDSIANTVSGCMIRSNGAECQGDACSQMWLENCRGTVVTGNTFWGWYSRKEGKFDCPYPYYGIVIRGLDGCVVLQNAMYHAASREAVRDYGGHSETLVGENAFVKPAIREREGGFDFDGPE